MIYAKKILSHAQNYSKEQDHKSSQRRTLEIEL
jgi:hypothetical protein